MSRRAARGVAVAIGLLGASIVSPAATAQQQAETGTPEVVPVALETPAAINAPSQARGQVTNLPLPRFVSMKAEKGNIRRGPSLSHRIDWIFLRQNMPLEITAEYGHWRRVRDREGSGGWIHYALLSGSRTVLIEKDMLQLHLRPDPQTPAVAALELGVVARLEKCNQEWCRLSAGGYRGWAPKTAMWGVAPDEIRD